MCQAPTEVHSGRPTTAATGSKGRRHEHSGLHPQRSDQQRRGAVHEGQPAVPAVRIFGAGRADPRPYRRAL